LNSKNYCKHINGFSEHPCQLPDVDGNLLAGSTRVRGLVTSDILCLLHVCLVLLVK